MHPHIASSPLRESPQAICHVTSGLILDRAILVLGVFIMLFLNAAQFAVGDSRSVATCKKLSERYNWRAAEKFIWEQTCTSAEADFNTKYGTTLDPSEASQWNQQQEPLKDRTVTSEFLETILFDGTLRKAIPRKGVQVVGAYFPDTIDLSDGDIPWDLCLCDSRFEKNLDISRLHAERSGILDRSFFSGTIGQDALKAQAVRIRGDFRLRGITSTFVDLNGAKIDGRLNLDESIVGQFTDNFLTIVGGEIDLDSASIGADLFIRDAKLPSAKLNAVFTTIGSNADFSDSILGTVDLSGTNIEGELRLDSVTWSGDRSAELRNFSYGRKRVNWQPEERAFILNNTKTGALVDSGPNSWPKKCDRKEPVEEESVSKTCTELELDGFTYERLGGFGQQTLSPAIARPSTYFVDWLDRDSTFSPQPYRQLYSVLRAAGVTTTAANVLFEGRKRSRKEATHQDALRLVWQFCLEKIVGYGLKWHFALLWAALLVLIGIVFLLFDGTNRKNDEIVGPVGFWFSVDYLLPVVRLNDAYFDRIKMCSYARVYFYIHQILGYLLVLFVIAGLSSVSQ